MNGCENDGHAFIVADERFSNDTPPWITRCECGQQKMIANFDRNVVWSFRVVEAGTKEGGE